jgi:hypothetical protein
VRRYTGSDGETLYFNSTLPGETAFVLFVATAIADGPRTKIENDIERPVIMLTYWPMGEGSCLPRLRLIFTELSGSTHSRCRKQP